MPTDMNVFRRAASILFGKLEMDVTAKELVTARKAHAMMQKGASMSAIRIALKITLTPLSDAARRRTQEDAARSKSMNLSAPDQTSRRRNAGYSVSSMSKGKPL